VNNLRVIAITHQQFPLETVGVFYIKPENRKDVLTALKESAGLKEVMYLATCNRVELVFTLDHFVCPGLTARILQTLRPDLDEEEVRRIAHQCDRYNGPEALEHILRVASSLESAVCRCRTYW
jgi:glutamyl-tRNA reductase